MIAVVPGWLSPETVEAVRRFRGRIYAQDGAVRLTGDGLHSEPADDEAYHLLQIGPSGLEGCLRYHRQMRRCRLEVRIGGWATAAGARGARQSMRLPIAAVRLAERFGDTYGIATATVRHNSAGMLRRLGGRLIARYWDSAYGCEMERLEFHLADMRRARLLVEGRRAA